MRAIGDSSLVHVLVMAKAPVSGRVKTRLCPPYTFDEAAALAEAAIADTLAAVAAAPAVRRTVVLDGAVGPWLPAAFSVIPQRGDGLDERLAAAFDDAQHSCPAPMLLVGMDTPQLTPGLISSSCHALTTHGTDAVLGPTADGGWWSLGLRAARSSLLLDVPMSTAQTFHDQLERLRSHSLITTVLTELVDVDDAETAAFVARQAPETRFAHTLSTLAVTS